MCEALARNGAGYSASLSGLLQTSAEDSPELSKLRKQQASLPEVDVQLLLLERSF